MCELYHFFNKVTIKGKTFEQLMEDYWNALLTPIFFYVRINSLLKAMNVYSRALPFFERERFVG